jgi:cytoskeletal protein CcmA (bactofilin family)
MSLRSALKAAALGVTTAFALFAAADEAAPARNQEQRLGSDLFVAGGSVRIDKPVAGDLFAAGGEIDVDAAVAGDTIMAGGNLRVAAPVAQGLYAAGGRLVIATEVGRSARVAGGRVDLASTGQISGNLTMCGGDVTIRGAVKGYLQACGGQVLIDGPVQGDVMATAGRVELGPNARIGGKLRYASGDEIRRDAGAQVAGGIERLAIPGRKAVAPGGAEKAPHEERTRRPGAGWLWTIGLMVLAALSVAIAPCTSARVSATLRARPGFALLLGFVTLVCVPVAALILLISILGIPLGVLLVLLYFVLLLLGYVSTGVALGDWALARLKADAAAKGWWRAAAAVLGVLAIALLGSVPVAGALVVLAALLLGLGAIVLLAVPGNRSGP